MHSQLPCIMQRSHHRRHLLLSILTGMHQQHLDLSEVSDSRGCFGREKG
jgi:hypothetical protein